MKKSNKDATKGTDDTIKGPKKEPYFFGKLKKMEISTEALEPVLVFGGSCPMYASTGAGCNSDNDVSDAFAPED